MAQAFPLNIITYCPMALHTYYMLMIHNFMFPTPTSSQTQYS